MFCDVFSSFFQPVILQKLPRNVIGDWDKKLRTTALLNSKQTAEDDLKLNL